MFSHTQVKIQINSKITLKLGKKPAACEAQGA